MTRSEINHLRICIISLVPLKVDVPIHSLRYVADKSYLMSDVFASEQLSAACDLVIYHISIYIFFFTVVFTKESLVLSLSLHTGELDGKVLHPQTLMCGKCREI